MGGNGRRVALINLRGVGASSAPQKLPDWGLRGRLQGYVNERLAESFKAKVVYRERNMAALPN